MCGLHRVLGGSAQWVGTKSPGALERGGKARPASAPRPLEIQGGAQRPPVKNGITDHGPGSGAHEVGTPPPPANDDRDLGAVPPSVTLNFIGMSLLSHQPQIPWA